MNNRELWNIDFKEVYSDICQGFWLVWDFLNATYIQIGKDIKFNLWELLLAFFVLDALILILLSRKPNNEEE